MVKMEKPSFEQFNVKNSNYCRRHMRPGATKGTLRRENENSFFDDLCLITFHWSF